MIKGEFFWTEEKENMSAVSLGVSLPTKCKFHMYIKDNVSLNRAILDFHHENMPI